MKEIKILKGIRELFINKSNIILNNFHPERPRAFGLRKTNLSYARNLNLAKTK